MKAWGSQRHQQARRARAAGCQVGQALVDDVVARQRQIGEPAAEVVRISEGEMNVEVEAYARREGVRSAQINSRFAQSPVSAERGAAGADTRDQARQQDVRDVLPRAVARAAAAGPGRGADRVRRWTSARPWDGKAMTNRVLIPASRRDQWIELCEESLRYVAGGAS